MLHTNASRRYLTILVMCGLMLLTGLGVEQRATHAQDEAQNAQLQAIGGLIAGYAHATYAMVGTTADGYANKVYDTEKVKSLMNEMRAMQQNIIRMLRKLQGTTLTREDDEFIDEAVSLFKLIGREAELLIEYSETNEQEVAQNFDKVRVEIGEKMAALFGQNSEEPAAEEKPDEDPDSKSKSSDDEADEEE